MKKELDQPRCNRKQKITEKSWRVKNDGKEATMIQRQAPRPPVARISNATSALTWPTKPLSACAGKISDCRGGQGFSTLFKAM